jgi:GNAT superfamily N-acetyltransferase
MTNETVAFVYECLNELRGDLQYSAKRFRDYVSSHGLFDHPDFIILVGRNEAEYVGMLSCNRFAMPRYLGFGFELEEVVVHRKYQGNGYGKGLIESFFRYVCDDTDVRKVLVKTDDAVKAGNLYRQYFEVVQTTVYAKSMNLL